MNRFDIVKNNSGSLIGKFWLDYSDIPFSIHRTSLSKNFDVHTHDFSELVAVIGGSGIHVINGERYPIRAGDIYVINGETSHGFENAINLVLYNIMFMPEMFSMWGNEIKKLPGFQALFVLEPYYRKQQQFRSRLQMSPGRREYPEDMLRVILEEFNEKKEGYELVIDAYFKALVVFLCREYTAERNMAGKGILPLAEAFATIEKDFLKPLNLLQLASSVPISVRQFIRIFKNNFGTTPMNHVILLRLQHACELMQTGQTSITGIAFDSGFSDSNYFTRQFRKHYNITPRDFIKNMKP